ncbi:MAG: NAD(+)/NADH kinase [Chloroflexi bacterium]|jgi:NAD+ kinase|nr:NAD(+)/NADH kinase [Chloroflexota bacterium]
MPGVGRIGVLYQAHRPESVALADWLSDALRAQGATVWRGDVLDEPALREAAPQLELLITLGGDGTIVRAVRASALAGLPVLGVNLGRLGFLAEIDPEQLEPALPRLLAGTFNVERRLLLHVEVLRGQTVLLAAEAVNEVVVSRGRVSRTVRVSVEADGRHIMTPTADGVIVSTPTGSTAYGLSAGGPIVSPELDCLAITPVAPHLGHSHSFVLPGRCQVTLALVRGEEATVTIDGQLDLDLAPGDRVCATASAHQARFVRLGGDGYFYDTVLRKLGWPDPA